VKYLRNEDGIIAFGKKMRELRLEKGFSQEQLAWKSGLEFSQISRIERGKINTSLSHILLIAEHLGVNPADFFTK
jgi:transcriptional regulator with XRE-family HTH domain